jgi:hypothetical protein
MCGRSGWRHAGAGAAGFVLGRAIFVSCLRSANLMSIQQHQHSVRKGKSSSHELIEM